MPDGDFLPLALHVFICAVHCVSPCLGFLLGPVSVKALSTLFGWVTLFTFAFFYFLLCFLLGFSGNALLSAANLNLAMLSQRVTLC